MNLTRTLGIVVWTTLLFWSLTIAAGNAKELPKRIYVASVEMPKKPDIVGKGALTATLLGGVLVGHMLDANTSDIETAYAQLLEKNGIDVGTDIAFETMEQLTKKGFEVTGTADQADATLRVHVQNYGLSVVKGSEGSIPVLTAIFILTDRNGKKLWTKQVIWAIVKDIKASVKPHPIPDYFNDPKVLVNEMTKLNSIVVSTALSKM